MRIIAEETKDSLDFVLSNSKEKKAIQREMGFKVATTISNQRGEEMIKCRNFIYTEEWQHLTTQEQLRKLKNINACKHRFCPTCNFFKSRKLAGKLICKLSQLNSREALLLTLTVPNVPLEALRAMVAKMNKAFPKMKKYKAFNAAIKGGIKALEITYSQDRNDYHPHFHILLLVDRYYFKSRDYIKRDEWLLMWQKCMNMPQITQVDIRKLKPKNGNKNAGVYETLKYSLKHTDLFKVPNDDFKQLYDEVAGLHSVSPFGELKDYASATCADIESFDKEQWLFLGEFLYSWNIDGNMYDKKKI